MLHFRAGDKGNHYPYKDIVYIKDNVWYQSTLWDYAGMMNDGTANLNNTYYTMGTRFIPLRPDTKQDVQITVHK